MPAPPAGETWFTVEFGVMSLTARYRGPDGGHIVWPTLLEEGVLVYTVDASIQSGDVPVRVLEDTGHLMVSDYPVLAVGDRATVRDYAITVVADDGDTHTVTVARIGGIQLESG